MARSIDALLFDFGGVFTDSPFHAVHAYGEELGITAEEVTGVPADAIRESARLYATTRKAGIYYTLGITEPVIEVDSEGTRELTGPIPHSRGRPWLGALASIFRTSGLFKGQKFVEMIEIDL